MKILTMDSLVKISGGLSLTQFLNRAHKKETSIKTALKSGATYPGEEAVLDGKVAKIESLYSKLSTANQGSAKALHIKDVVVPKLSAEIAGFFG
jgi:hypothetical protein